MKKIVESKRWYLLVVLTFAFLIIPGAFYWTFLVKKDNSIVTSKTYQNGINKQILLDTEQIDNMIAKGSVKKVEVKKMTYKPAKKVVKKVKKVTVTKPVKKATRNDKEDPDKYKVCGTPDDGITIKEAIEKYKNNDGSISLGIDVSAHQGNIDFKKVKQSGIDFVIIRAGFTGWGTGEMKKDAYFLNNIREAKAAGLKVGAYYYSAAITEEEAALEAQLTIDIVQSSGYGLDYPIALDYEETSKNKAHRGWQLTNEDRTNIALTYLSYIEQHSRYKTMFYTSINAYRNKFVTSELMGYNFWVAHFIHKANTTTNYKGQSYIWQYASDGNVPGITTCVDMDIAYYPV